MIDSGRILYKKYLASCITYQIESNRKLSRTLVTFPGQRSGNLTTAS